MAIGELMDLLNMGLIMSEKPDYYKIHGFSTNLPYICCLPGTMQEVWDTMVPRTTQNPVLIGVPSMEKVQAEM